MPVTESPAVNAASNVQVATPVESTLTEWSAFAPLQLVMIAPLSKNRTLPDVGFVEWGVGTSVTVAVKVRDPGCVRSVLLPVTFGLVLLATNAFGSVGEKAALSALLPPMPLLLKSVSHSAVPLLSTMRLGAVLGGVLALLQVIAVPLPSVNATVPVALLGVTVAVSFTPLASLALLVSTVLVLCATVRFCAGARLLPKAALLPLGGL